MPRQSARAGQFITLVIAVAKVRLCLSSPPLTGCRSLPEPPEGAIPAVRGASELVWFSRPGLVTVCPYVPSLPLTSGDNPRTPAYAAAIAGSL